MKNIIDRHKDFAHLYNDMQSSFFNESIVKMTKQTFIVNNETYKFTTISEVENNALIKKLLVINENVSFLINYNFKTSKKFAVVFENRNADLLCYADDYTVESVVETCENYIQFIFDNADDFSKCFFIEVKKTDSEAHNETLTDKMQQNFIEAVKHSI